MKKLFNKNYIVMASLMVLMPLSAEAHLPLSAEAHLPSSAEAHHFDAVISGQKMTLQQCFELADKQNLALQTGRKAIEIGRAHV